MPSNFEEFSVQNRPVSSKPKWKICFHDKIRGKEIVITSGQEKHTVLLLSEVLELKLLKLCYPIW